VTSLTVRPSPIMMVYYQKTLTIGCCWDFILYWTKYSKDYIFIMTNKFYNHLEGHWNPPLLNNLKGHGLLGKFSINNYTFALTIRSIKINILLDKHY